MKWIPKEKIITTNIWSSELAKLSSNAMLAQRISSINSLSALCEKTGADIEELSKAIGMDHRIGSKFLKASVGFGGSCFQKDILNLVYLCKYYGLYEVAEYWHQVIKINNYQKSRFAQKIIDGLDGNVEEKKIALLGWAFKKKTNDSRESPAIFVTKELFEKGAIINIYDPMVSKNSILADIENHWGPNIDKDEIQNRLKVLKTIKELKNNYDAIAILTEWDEFIKLDWKNISKKTKVYDGRNILKSFDSSNIQFIGK